MDKISAERMRPIREEVYLAIRQKILSGEFKPGDRLQEEQLARQFGTSRTPVREALRKLEVENFVVYYPHHGTVVAEVATDEVDDLQEVRILIESLIIRRATKNVKPENIQRLRRIIEEGEALTDPDKLMANVDLFNATMFAIGKCKNLEALNIRVREILRRVVVSKYLHPKRHNVAVAEHKLLVDALEARDADLAVARIIEHLRNSPKTYKL
ncbi:MAG: GntR family transcriptional regulator [Synergistaceae bacterium]|jgi:DNA-binding GntR family transcriptional regulator|nr:GntR family transcriptional regulator [Synergistaceae bacterium]